MIEFIWNCFFKKLRLCIKKIRALKITHIIEKFINILKKHIKKIIKWLIFTTQSKFKKILSVVEIIKKWIRNFVELIKSLSKLTSKVKWKWTLTKQLSFEIFKIKCIIKFNMHEIDLRLLIYFYIDASIYEIDLIITQFQKILIVNSSKINLMKIFITYNFFILFSFWRRYSAY